jgi:hypothetical protein
MYFRQYKEGQLSQDACNTNCIKNPDGEAYLGTTYTQNIKASNPSITPAALQKRYKTECSILCKKRAQG